MWQIYQGLKATFMPNFCASCRLFLKDSTIFCGSCIKLIKPIASKDIALTSSITLPIFAASAYRHPLKDLIIAKSCSDTWAAHCLAHLIITHTPLELLPADYFIPIPLHWSRYAYRGYNQSKIIAHHLAYFKNAKIAEPLFRSKRTPFQSSLPLDQRSQNVANAFHLTDNMDLRKKLSGQHLILVDDLMTTGSTLKEAARQLLQLKPASLKAIVACRI